MPQLQTVYNRAPVPIQHLMATLSGYQKNRGRYGKVYREHRVWLSEFDDLSLEQKLAHQTSTLRSFLSYAVERSEFYKTHFSNHDLGSINSIADLQFLPFLEKEDLRNNVERIITVPEKGSIPSSTGGTAGKPLVVRMTIEDSMKRMAMLDHFKSRVGFEHRKMRRATFMGKHIVAPNSRHPIFWRYNHACKQMLYSSFHLSDQNLAWYVKSLNKFKPQALDGFFTAMLDVAHYIERNNIRLTYKPLAIFPTSETITDQGKKTLERVFGARVYNQYASSEGAPFITECGFGSLHVEHSSGVFEPVTSGSHETAVTSFTTHGTPLIRYKIGDLVELGGYSSCDCGNESMLVRRILGRTDDYLLRADGGRINSAVAANMFKVLSNSVNKAQIIQESMDSITILLEVDNANLSDEQTGVLKREFRHVFGDQTSLKVKEVAEIPREKSGKHRFIRNHLVSQDPLSH